MSTTESTIWEQRWEVLESQINELIMKTMLRRRNPNLNRSQKKAIQCLELLLGSLKSFTVPHFSFFEETFNGNPHGYKKSPEYPPEHVLAVTLRQVGHDLSVISQAINQRFSQEAGLRETLAVADYLSWQALQPAAKAFGLAETRVICYLQKSPTIRVIPYAKVALIGIPQTLVGAAQAVMPDVSLRFGVPRDFLAIPHEVGHYVFWNGLVEKQESPGHESIATLLQNAVSEDDRKHESYSWLEEMFADIYGCFVVGPAIALSFQDLHLQKSQPDLFRDDHDHPPPVLRPHIYNKVLHNADYKALADELNDRWLNKVYGNQYNDKCGNPKNVEEVISIDPSLLDDVGKPVDKLMKTIFDKANILGLEINGNWWREYFGKETNLQSLYPDFDQRIREFTFDEKVVEILERKTGEGIPYGHLLSRWNSKQPGDKDPGWLRRFDAGGWTTEGPDCDGSTGSC